MRNWGSVVRGVRAMRRPFVEPQPGWAIRPCRGFWAHWWTPVWHEGRGPYVSIGAGLFAVYRGY